jgi:hypothetical protein
MRDLSIIGHLRASQVARAPSSISRRRATRASS